MDGKKNIKLSKIMDFMMLWIII